MPRLRDGEKKILDALQDEPKEFSELSKQVPGPNGKPRRNKSGILNPSILSSYLKNLQTKGLIERDIKTRKYVMKEISYASLLFKDLVDFIEKYLKDVVSKDLKKGIAIYERSLLFHEQMCVGWLVLTEATELLNDFTQILKKPETVRALLKISENVDDLWNSYILSKYSPTKRKVIETYERFLIEIVKKIRFPRSEDQHKDLYELQTMMARFKLKKAYPGVPIPKEMVRIEAERAVKELEKAQEQIYYSRSVEDLYHMIESLDRVGQLRRDLTEIEVKELEEMIDFLTDSRNRKIYGDYISRRDENPPKTLIFNLSLGFGGHLRKLAESFPEVFQKQVVDGLKSHLENHKLHTSVNKDSRLLRG